MYSHFMSTNSILLFNKFCEVRNFEESTIVYYDAELSRFLNFTKQDVFAITSNMANAYYHELDKQFRNKRLKYSTFAKKIKTLKSFFSWCYYESENKAVPENGQDPFSGIHMQDAEYIYREEDVWSLNALNDIYKIIFNHSISDYIFFQLVFFSLVKPSQLLKVKRSQFIVHDGHLYLTMNKTKTTKERTIKLPDALIGLLEEHLRLVENGPIFLNTQGKPLNLRTAERRLEKYRELAGYGTKEEVAKKECRSLTPSDFYHSGIYYARLNGMSKEELQYQMGIYEIEYLDKYIIPDAELLDETTGICDYIEIRVIKTTGYEH